MSQLRETTTEEGVLISRGLLQRVLDDLAMLKSDRVSRLDAARKAVSYSANGEEKEKELPWRITAVEVIESNFWRYSAELMSPMDSESSSRGYIVHPSGFTTQNMYNEAEYGNGSINAFTIDGVEAFGNGLIRSQLPAGYSVKPLPINRIVWARPVIVKRDASDAIEYRFCEPNGISGACP